MKQLGFGEREIEELLDCCAGVLLGSRIHFEDAEGEGSKVDDQSSAGKRGKDGRGGRRRTSTVAEHTLDACSECAAAFGVGHDELAEALTHRTIVVGGQKLKANLTPVDAEDCRDALAKHAYAGPRPRLRLETTPVDSRGVGMRPRSTILSRRTAGVALVPTLETRTRRKRAAAAPQRGYSVEAGSRPRRVVPFGYS